MPKFKLARNRDAWFVIRGYKYQVDLTILRWLSLNQRQTLVLEFGEDIDIVNDAMFSMIDRELEQIKHLETSVTLRTPASRTAIANAVSHFARNPHQELLFRFCTNASVTTERPSPFDDRLPAIEVWESIRKGKHKKNLVTVRVEGLLRLLRQFKKPDDIEEDTWTQFEKTLSNWSVDELLQFIERFEWSTQLPNADDIVGKIEEKLIELHFSPAVANDVYARLFLHVMVKISQQGVKELTRAEIDQLLELPNLDEKSRNQLAFLNAQLLCNTARIESLEAESVLLFKKIDAVKSQMLGRTFGKPVSIQLTTAIDEIQTELPPVAEPSCSRAAVIAHVNAKTINNDWLAIYGSLGSGKTQLAALFGRERDSVLYVSLRDLSSAEADFLLHHLFKQLCSGNTMTSLTQSGLEFLENGTVLILDDVPKLVVGDKLSNRLNAIARAVVGRNQTLVTLSHFPIPYGIVNALGDVRFEEVQAIPLNTDETKELFVNHGAPRELITDEIANSFVKSTAGNPTLLAAHALNLQSLGWQNVEEQRATSAELILGGELIDQTMERLLQTASQSATREFLYRHCVILGPFSRNESSAVANVDPVIVRPNEHLSILQGPWIERQANAMSVVCPLIAESGIKQLESATMKGVAVSLAELIVSRRFLDPIEFSKLIHYLKLANDPVRLALCLLGALRSIDSVPIGWKRLISFVVLDNELLNGFPTSLALLLKAHQIRLALQIEAPVEQLIADGQRLIAVADDVDRWAVSNYAIQVAPKIAEVKFDVGLQLCNFVLKNFAKVIEDLNTKFGHSTEKYDVEGIEELESVFCWLFVPSIKNADQFSKWMDVIFSQDGALIEKICSVNISAWGMQIAVDRLWQEQHEIPRGNREFEPIHQVYDRLIVLLKERGLHLFEAIVVRAKIVVLAEYEQNMAKAVEIAQPYLNHSNDEVRFLINDIVGRQHQYANQNSDAVLFLETAIGIDTNTFDSIRFRTFLTLAKIVGNASDSARALRLCEDAVEIANRSPNQVAELDLIVALGEAANAAWLDSNHRLAFRLMDQVFVTLERAKANNVDWKMRYTLIGNALGYMASMSAMGVPPGEGYVTPQRGYLLGYNEAAAKWYDNNNYEEFDVSSGLLVMFATACEEFERAAYWANKGLERARLQGYWALVYEFAETLVPINLRQGKFIEACDLGLECAIASAVCVVSSRGGESILRIRSSIAETLGSKPSEAWNHAEQNGVYRGILPAVLQCLSKGTNLTALREIRDHCRHLSASSSAPKTYEALVEGLTLVLEDWKALPLHNLANERYSANDAAGGATLHALSSFAPDAPIEQSILFHMMILHSYVGRLSEESSIWAFVCELISSYWATTFNKQRFSFSNPSETERRLREAKNLEPTNQVKMTINAIASGLRIRIPDAVKNAQEWFLSKSKTHQILKTLESKGGAKNEIGQLQSEVKSIEDKSNNT